MSEIFELPVNALLGENLPAAKTDDLKTIAEKLEVINLQLSERKKTQRKIIRWVLISLCLIIIITAVLLFILGSPYSDWDYSDPETAVLGTAVHSFEWLFVRIAPLILLASIIGIIFTLKKN